MASSPSTSSRVVLSRVTVVTGINFFSTTTAQEADFSPEVAVMMADPGATATTFPSATVATAALEVLQVTVLSVASSGFTVAERVASSPSTSFRAVLSRVTEVTGINFLATVTVQVSAFSPALAMMEARPSLTAVTLPASSTVAISALSVLQITAGSVASSGRTVAESWASSPSTSSRDFLLSVTVSTGMNFLATVTTQVSENSPALAMMEARPSLRADTWPVSSTVATSAWSVLQVTVLSVASSGSTVAESWAPSPSTSSSAFLSRVTEETSTSGIPACFTVNFCETVPHLMVTDASRSSFPLLGWADTVNVTVPAEPLVGWTESQVEDLTSVASAVQAWLAVNFTVWLCSCVPASRLIPWEKMA